MKQSFMDARSFTPESTKWIRLMADITRTMRARGYMLSLRQVYYQLVAHHGLPNREQSYKNIGNLLSAARLAGLIDWDSIEDRNRETIRNSHWDSPADIVRACANQFRVDLWKDQPTVVWVMVEKAALEGVIEPVCRRLDVPFTSNRGYSSSSAMYETGRAIYDHLQNDQDVRVIYLGDHDPSGIDMTRDVFHRLGLFAEVLEYENGKENDPLVYTYDYVGPYEWDDLGNCDETDDGNYEPDTDGQTMGHKRFQVIRAALNHDQIVQYAPPPNPAKMTDSRAGDYVRRYGRESWELDALDPDVLAALVERHVLEYRDEDIYETNLAEQNAGREALKTKAAELEAERAIDAGDTQPDGGSDE